MAGTSATHYFVKVILPFTAARDDELTVTEGDIVKILERLDANWSRGELKGKVGVFPTNHTTPHVRDMSPGGKTRPTETIARALFDFKGGGNGDLTFRKNDVIEVVREVNSDWLEGKLNEMCGIFPKSFVRIESSCRKQIGSNNSSLRSITSDKIPERKVDFQYSSQQVVLREKKKPVPRPRTVIVPKTSSAEVSTGLVTRDDMAIKQLSNAQRSSRIVSVPKPAPRPRLSLQSAIDISKSSVEQLSVDFGHLSNGFETIAVAGSHGGCGSMVNGMSSEGKLQPAGQLKPRVTTKPPISPKPSVKRKWTQSRQQGFNTDGKSFGKMACNLAIPAVRHRPAPCHPVSQAVLPTSVASDLLVDVLVTQQPSDHSVVINSTTLREDHCSDPSTVTVQKEEKQFLSPSQEKDNNRDSSSSHDSGISVSDIEQKIQETKDRLRLEMTMAQTIETTLRHVTTSESPTLRLKMEKCSDSVQHLKAQLQELERMKEEDDLNAKVPFESSHVVVANSTGEDGWTWSKENSSYMGRMDSETLPNTSDNSRSNCDEAIDMDRGSLEHSPSPTDLAAKQARNRMRVISELIETERRHVADLTVACEKIRLPLKQQQIDGLDVNTLFGNMEEVAQVSRDFLDCLIQHQQEDTLGECFTRKADQLKEAYSKYSCNHDKALALLEKFEYIPAARQAIMVCLQSAKDELSCWPLSALLIKPVQRILKYPLLLNELLKSTADDHPDKGALIKAADLMTDVAQEVNESKRRKELVEHYRRTETDGFLTKFGRLNFHTWKKKTQRARQMVSQGLGFSLGTVDEGFNHTYSQFRDLDAVTQSLLKNIAAYLSAVQSWHQCHVTACQSICEFYGDGAPEPAVVQYTEFHEKLLSNINSQLTVRIEGLVLTPLKQLKSLFDAPNYLIEKRDHKLLDYDSWKKKVANTQNKEKLSEYREEMVMAGRMYEALNTQLLNDLPLLVNCGVKVIHQTLAAFVSSHRQHVTTARESIEPLMQCAIVKGHADSLMDRHLSQLAAVTGQLSSCRCIPNSFLTSVNLQQQKATSPKQIVRAGTMKTDTTGLLASTLMSPSNSPISSRSLSPLLKDMQVQSADNCLYYVEFSFSAGGVGEMSVTKGDRVCVKQKHDESGSCEWWLIQFNRKEGFVPAAYLTPVCEDDYCVEYDFDGDEDGELSVSEGQCVRVKQQHDEEGNTDWWLCECEDKVGYVPSSYLAKRDVLY